MRTLLLAPDGALYAGTAAEAGGAGPAGPEPLLASGRRTSGRAGSTPRSDDAGRARASAQAQTRTQPPDRQRARPLPRPRGWLRRAASRSRRATTPSTGSTPTASRARSSGPRRSSSRSPGLDDRLLVGTGPEGQLYEVRDRGSESHAARQAR